jgi:hypothetical protein
MLLTDWLRVLSASKGWNRAQRQVRNRRRKGAGFMAAVDVASQPESLEPRLLLSAGDINGEIELTTISGSTGFQFTGGANNQDFGSSLRAAGDVNGDGFEDVIISDYSYGAGSGGVVYVLFGKSSGFSPPPDLNNLLASDGFKIQSAGPGTNAGSAVSGGGDVNGDGFDDLVIMAANYTPVHGVASGYVVFGKATSSTVNLSDIDVGASDTLGFRFTSPSPATDFITTRYKTANSVATGGDINGDGYDDVVFGAPYSNVNGVASVGAAYVVFGRSGGFANLTPASLNGSNGFVFTDSTTASEGAFIGASVSIGGDVDGDGLDDLLVGAPHRESSANGYDGEAYVVFGRPSFVGSAQVTASSLLGPTGFKATGQLNVQAVTGISVSSGGDVNGDGLDDFIIGASGYSSDYGPVDGRAYVVFGKTSLRSSSTLTLTSLSGSNGFILKAGGATDLAGTSVSITGDINGDGYDDILVGAPTETYNGHAYVIFGASSIIVPTNLDALNGVNGFALLGTSSEYAGDTVAFAGDINGDGFDDILIGEPKASKGRVTVFFGTDFGLHDGSGANGELGTGIQQFNGSANGSLTATQPTVPDILVAGRGNDTLTSNGGADILIGGQGDDTLVATSTNLAAFSRFDGGTGVDVFAFGGTFSGQVINLTTIHGNQIKDIEVINLDYLNNATTETLTLDLATVLAITGAGTNIASTSPYAENDAHTLTILRNADDVINGIDTANGWTKDPNVSRNGKTFEVFTKAGATVRIQKASVATGDIDGNNNFDNNDSFLINIIFLGADDNLISFFNGGGLTVEQIRAAIDELIASGALDVDGTGATNNNDTFLVNIIKLGADDTLVAFFNGGSLSVAQIRQNVDSLTPASGRAAPPAQPPADEPVDSAAPETPSFLAPPVTDATESEPPELSPQVASLLLLLPEFETASPDDTPNDQTPVDASEPELVQSVTDEAFLTTQMNVTMDLLA